MTTPEAVALVRQMQAREQRCTGRDHAAAIREAVEMILALVALAEVASETASIAEVIDK